MLRVDRPLILAVVVAVAGLAQFTVAVPLSMQSYPGGTLHDADKAGYSWSQNWLSDLGRTRAWNGHENLFGARMFNGSIIALGISLAIFFAISIRANEEFSFMSLVSAGAGVVAAIGLIGIGMTPFDRYHSLHIAMLLLWILPMIVVAITFSYLSLRSGGLSGIVVAAASSILVGGMVVYALASSSTNVMAVQKLAVALSLAWFALLVWRVGMTAIYVIVETRSRLQLVNEQAGRYMNQIQKQHLKPYRRLDD